MRPVGRGFRKLLCEALAAALAAGGAACSGGGGGASLPPFWGDCATPEDADLPADFEVTAEDVDVDLGPDGFFYGWTYNGDIPGPAFRIDMGETRTIKLTNLSPRPATLHFHGVSYPPEDDGTPVYPESIVNPGCAHIYTVTAVAPGVWPFHSHMDPRTEISQGLMGLIVVPDPAEPPADHEYVVFLGQLGLEEEGEEEGGEEEEEEEEGESGEAPQPFFMVINGRANGNALVIEWNGSEYAATAGAMAHAGVGDRVRWRVLNASPDDYHTIHVHAHRWCDRGGVVDGSGLCPNGGLLIDNESIAPAEGITFEYIEDAPGEWMVHCHIVDHVVDGMWAMYHVDP